MTGKDRQGVNENSTGKIYKTTLKSLNFENKELVMAFLS
jgi:hypothetical protein